MDRDQQAPAAFTAQLWDIGLADSDDDSLQLASVTLNDADDVNTRLSYCDHQLLQPVTPPIDTGSSSHSDDSLVSHR